MASKSSCARRKEVVLVTGGSGLVGSALSLALKDEKDASSKYEFIFVSSKDANLVDANATKLLFSKYQPTYIIHLAAKVGGLYANMEANDTFYELNAKINANVLQVALELKVRKCISCLSTCVFPNQVVLPLTESKIHLGPPHESNRGYSMAKREVDLLNKRLNLKNEGTSLFTSVIPTNLYGINDNFDLTEAHVIPGLIHKAHLAVLDAIKNGRGCATLRVLGTGNAIRQFLYAPDLARFMLWCLQFYNEQDPIIVCPDITEEFSIRDVAEIICDIYSRKFRIKVQPEFDAFYADGQLKKTASNERLRSLIPEFNSTTLQEGLNDVIDWFCEVYPRVRMGKSIV